MSGNDYKLVQLANGTASVYSSAYGEKMHPGLGPAAEADLLYVRQLKIAERMRAESGEFVIWDVGLGAAANALAVLRATREISRPLRLLSFDNTAEPLAFALENAEALGYLGGYEAQVEALYMHDERGLEDLVLAQTTAAALQRFAALVTWPPHLVQKHGDPVANAAAALPDLLAWNKGGWSLADFLAQCTVAEVPQFLRDVCAGLRAVCQPADADDDEPPEGQANAA